MLKSFKQTRELRNGDLKHHGSVSYKVNNAVDQCLFFNFDFWLWLLIAVIYLLLPWLLEWVYDRVSIHGVQTTSTTFTSQFRAI